MLPVMPQKRRRGARSLDRTDGAASDRINAVVAAAFMIPVDELRAETRRSAPVALARQSAMYLAHIALGWSFSEVGRAFGRNRTTAARACRTIEDRREEARLDAALAQIEQSLRLRGSPGLEVVS